MKRLCLMITAILLTFTFCACDFDESDNSFRGGELLDNDKMSELKDKYVTEETDEAKDENESFASEKQTEKQTEMQTEKKNEIHTEIVTDTETPGTLEGETETLVSDEQGERVFWTKSGSVWHTTDQCHHLKKSKNIESGSVEEAMEAGKSKACSSCGK